MVNFAVVVFTTLQTWLYSCLNKRADRKKTLAIEERKSNRQLIVKEVPDLFKAYELELEVQDAVVVSKSWLIQRKWLKANQVDFSDFDEEKQFQQIWKDHEFGQKIE